MPIACIKCGDADWTFCFPGTEAETRAADNGTVLFRPEPEIPLAAWCRKCWPFLQEIKKSPGKSGLRKASIAAMSPSRLDMDSG